MEYDKNRRQNYNYCIFKIHDFTSNHDTISLTKFNKILTISNCYKITPWKEDNTTI